MPKGQTELDRKTAEPPLKPYEGHFLPGMLAWIVPYTLLMD